MAAVEAFPSWIILCCGPCHHYHMSQTNVFGTWIFKANNIEELLAPVTKDDPHYAPSSWKLPLNPFSKYVGHIVQCHCPCELQIKLCIDSIITRLSRVFGLNLLARNKRHSIPEAPLKCINYNCISSEKILLYHSDNVFTRLLWIRHRTT